MEFLDISNKKLLTQEWKIALDQGSKNTPLIMLLILLKDWLNANHKNSLFLIEQHNWFSLNFTFENKWCEKEYISKQNLMNNKYLIWDLMIEIIWFWWYGKGLNSLLSGVFQFSYSVYLKCLKYQHQSLFIRILYIFTFHNFYSPYFESLSWKKNISNSWQIHVIWILNILQVFSLLIFFFIHHILIKLSLNILNYYFHIAIFEIFSYSVKKVHHLSSLQVFLGYVVQFCFFQLLFLFNGWNLWNFFCLVKLNQLFFFSL